MYKHYHTFKKMAHAQALPLAAFFSYFSVLFLTHFTSSESTGFSLKLIPIFSPESPLYPGNLSQSERIHKMFEISKARANYMASMSKPNAFQELEDIHLPMAKQELFYSVEVNIGTPMKPQHLLFDTASSLVWTQCQPCIRCFDQTTPIFDPRASTTYSEIPCNDPLCRSPFKCQNGKCVYTRRYHVGDVTRGLASRETFAFPVRNGFTFVPRLAFGCSNDNSGFAFGGKISGILGFNASPLSLSSQLRNRIQGLFSYCLVREMEATSVIKFGRDADVRRRDLETTPILLPDIRPHFYLHLLEISIGRHIVRFPPGAFDIMRDGTGGFIIDTGTPVTFIRNGPYQTLMQRYDQILRSLGRQRIPYNASQEFDYCYRYDSSFKAYPSMTFHLQEADYIVQPENMYFIEPDRGRFCVAIQDDPKYSILGAWQQQNMLIIYDLNVPALRFGSENCANGRQ
ncbi:hypothetical protein CUMW_140230 [Citrus unshiu]|nr:hypothetical protein CUMW_140230 [Citrus unshiu]